LTKQATGEVSRQFAELLTYRTMAQIEEDRATNIALDDVGNGLVCDRGDFEHKDLADRARRARLCLIDAQSQKSSAIRAGHQALKCWKLIKLTPLQREREFASRDGPKLPDGTVFKYQADPHMQPYFRVEQDARNVLATALDVIYWRAVGAKPYVPKDGRKANRFMKFLDAACASLPNPAPTSLHSSARTLLQRATKYCVMLLEEVLRRESADQVGTP
jgi:hypothetical protein